jgi:phage major head subunit gpT-like protein
MNRSFNPRQLEEGLHTVFGLEYNQHPEEWRQIFEVMKSSKAYEEDVLMTGFGAAVNKSEGSSVTYDQALEGWLARYNHETVALAFSITEEDVEDNLYMAKGAKLSKALARSMQHTKEMKGAAVLNNGFDPNYAGGDGQPLFSAAHPLVSGSDQANMLTTPADLSETAIEDLLIMIRRSVDDRMLPISLIPKDIIIPPEEEYNATRILRSSLRSGTADNDINAMKSKGIFTKDPVVITRLVDPDAWFIKTDAPDGLLHFVRRGVKKKMNRDFNTGNHRYMSSERYSNGWTDWRGCFGSSGS